MKHLLFCLVHKPFIVGGVFHKRTSGNTLLPFMQFAFFVLFYFAILYCFFFLCRILYQPTIAMLKFCTKIYENCIQGKVLVGCISILTSAEFEMGFACLNNSQTNIIFAFQWTEEVVCMRIANGMQTGEIWQILNSFSLLNLVPWQSGKNGMRA